MFKLNPAPTFAWAVNLTRPGEAEPVKVEFTFRHKGKAAIDEWVKRSGATKGSGDDAALLGEIIEAWGVQDDAGAPAPLSAENLRAAVDNFPSLAFEVTTAYMKALGKSRAKN